MPGLPRGPAPARLLAAAPNGGAARRGVSLDPGGFGGKMTVFHGEIVV